MKSVKYILSIAILIAASFMATPCAAETTIETATDMQVEPSTPLTVVKAEKNAVKIQKTEVNTTSEILLNNINKEVSESNNMLDDSTPEPTPDPSFDIESDYVSAPAPTETEGHIEINLAMNEEK